MTPVLQGLCSKLAQCAAWLLRDEARGAKSKASLDGWPEFATQRIARKTTARQGSAQNGHLTHLLACVCRPAHDAPSRHASHPVLNPNAHRGSFEHHPQLPRRGLASVRAWLSGAGLLAILISPAVQAQSVIAAPVPTNVVQLSAHGMLEVPQDWLTMGLVVNKEGTDAAQVQAQLTSAMDAALAIARAAAVEPQLRVRSGRFGVFPRYDKAGKVSGWRGQAELMLEGRDFTRIAQVAARMQPLVVASMAFSLSKEAQQALESDAQVLAIERFQRRAGEVAKAFGFSAYELREVSVSSADAGEERLFRGQAMAMDASISKRDDEPVPVEPGRSRLTVTVSGSVQLKQ